MCGPANHDVMRYTGYEEGALRGIRLERWVDDGSEAFRKAFDRIQKEGAYIERPDIPPVRGHFSRSSSKK